MTGNEYIAFFVPIVAASVFLNFFFILKIMHMKTDTPANRREIVLINWGARVVIFLLVLSYLPTVLHN